MPARSFNSPIAALREQIAAMEGDGGPAREVLPFGLPELDRRLPGGGLALGCLHEVAGGGNGAVDGAAASCFAAGIAAPLPIPGLGRARWLIELIRARAGESLDIELEACDGTGHLGHPAALADRPAQTVGP